MAVISIDNAPHYAWGESCDGWHLLQTDNLSIIEERVPAGEQERRHYHVQAQQFFYVLSGQASLEVCGEHYQLDQGQGCHVPAGAIHQLSNHGADDLRFLLVSQPRSHGDRVNE